MLTTAISREDARAAKTAKAKSAAGAAEQESAHFLESQEEVNLDEKEAHQDKVYSPSLIHYTVSLMHFPLVLVTKCRFKVDKKSDSVPCFELLEHSLNCNYRSSGGTSRTTTGTCIVIFILNTVVSGNTHYLQGNIHTISFSTITISNRVETHPFPPR